MWPSLQSGCHGQEGPKNLSHKKSCPLQNPKMPWAHMFFILAHYLHFQSALHRTIGKILQIRDDLRVLAGAALPPRQTVKASLSTPTWFAACVVSYFLCSQVV